MQRKQSRKKRKKSNHNNCLFDSFSRFLSIYSSKRRADLIFYYEFENFFDSFADKCVVRSLIVEPQQLGQLVAQHFERNLVALVE